MPARGGIRFEHIIQAGQRARAQFIHHRLDHRGDGKKRQPPLEEGGDRNFVGGVQRRRAGTAFLQGTIPQPQRRKAHEIRRRKIEPADAGQVERAHARFNPLRVGQRVRDRRAHVGVPKLGDDRAIGVFDHGMHDALRMDHHLNLLRRCSKQPVRLDDFERLVHHGGRIHRDLSPHHPVWMGAGLIRRHALQLCQVGFPERSAGSGQQHTPHAVAAQITGEKIGQALEYGIVLAVDGQQRRTMSAHRVHEDGPGHNQGFLIRQQQLLAGARRGEGGCEAGRADDCRHDAVGFWMGRNLLQSLRADQDLRRACVQARIQCVGLRGMRHHCVARFVAQTQFGQCIDALICAQGKYAETLRMPRRYIEGVEPDGTGRPEYGEILQPAHDRYTRAATGSTAVRASMRSSTPPWPGNSAPLSLTPACRFNADSNKSP